MTTAVKTTTLTLAGALNAGLRQAMSDDPKVVLIGEDIGRLGGVFRVTDGLQQDFGPRRVFDSPLAESGIVGTAIGLALRGYRPSATQRVCASSPAPIPRTRTS
jgi:2-oxoisovalerate dehydrogenase E1 component beta subunit